MTSSETQTEAARLRRFAARHSELIAALSLVAAGWLIILAINGWHLGAPAVFLCLGWVSIVAAGKALWAAALRGGSEGEEEDLVEEPVTDLRRTELEREKRALLKAIKEVEFDRELGKMSQVDADEITRVYRARAIEILKLLDAETVEDTADEPLDQVIEREVRARLALAGVRSKVKTNVKPQPQAGSESPADSGAAGGDEVPARERDSAERDSAEAAKP
jgi:hypothetical protein